MKKYFSGITVLWKYIGVYNPKPFSFQLHCYQQSSYQDP